MTKHSFKATLNWPTPEQENVRMYEKNHIISIEGKSDLTVSAAKVFKGDPALYNPEDLLLSSLMSCHMMSYLYCCAVEKIKVISYKDFAEATLETQRDGSGRITKVTLHPEVIISEPEKVELALALHTKANQLCFIANSCNFEVEHNAKVGL
jgi:organic hydroperoxide reductase OsmC/OhrA